LLYVTEIFGWENRALRLEEAGLYYIHTFMKVIQYHFGKLDHEKLK